MRWIVVALALAGAASCTVQVDCDSCRCECGGGLWIDVCHPDACGPAQCRQMCDAAFGDRPDDGTSLPDRVEPDPGPTDEDAGDAAEAGETDAADAGGDIFVPPDAGPQDAPDLPDESPPDAGPVDPGPADAADIPDPADTGVFTPEFCNERQGSGCPEGFACVTPPCPNCGMRPPSVCLPPPCAARGCWLDGDCEPTERCEGTAPLSGQQGRCLAVPDTGGCWTDADCPAQAECKGAARCNTCDPCKIAEHPGTCAARAGVSEVVLWIRGGMFPPFGVITPYWFNLTEAPIWLSGCSTYHVEHRLPDGGWEDLGAGITCVTEGNAVRLDAGQARKDAPVTKGADDINGTYRLRGTYGVNCTAGLPLGQADCSQYPQVLSGEYFVGAAP